MPAPVPIAGSSCDPENCRELCLESPYIQYHDTAVYLENWHIDTRYLSLSKNHHSLPTGSMLKLVQKELETLFHETTAESVRIFPGPFTTEWRHYVLNTFSIPVVPVDYYRGELSGSGMLRGFFNKHIAIYFEHSASRNTDSEKIGQYIYRHWLRMYNDRPPFQNGHFLAKPISFVEGTYSNNTPRVTDLPFALRFHQSLCDSIAARENDIPFGSEPRRSFKDSGYRLAHLFRSIFMVVDNCEDNEPPEREDMWKCRDYMIEPASGYETPPEPGRLTKSKRERRRRYVDWHWSRSRVLLVRTGDESHLSESISFQPLFDEGLALPLMRNDVSPENVVRVRLDTALEFVEGLIRREEEAVPQARQVAEEFEHELDEKCRVWMEKVLKHAEEVGIDNNGFTWHAMRRAEARLNGEAFDIDQIWPIGKSLASWYHW